MRGQRGCERRGLRSGAGLSRIPGPVGGRGLSGSRGEGLCLQRSRRGRGGEGRNSNSRERALAGEALEARGKKGFKQENVARVGVHGDRGPKPPQKHLKPERKYN